MAKNVTLLVLRTKVQFQGDFENSSVFTPARIDVMINEAVEEFWDLLLDTRPESLLKTAAAVTVSGSDSVAFPTDLYRLRLVEILVGTDYFPLTPHSVSEAWRYQRGPADGRRFTYRVEPGALTPFAPGIRLAPTPAAVHTLRLKYYPPATDLVLDADTLDSVNGFDSLVVARVIAKLKGGREGTDSSWWDAEARRCEEGMRAAAGPIDVGEPYSLSGQAGDSPGFEWLGLRGPF